MADADRARGLMAGIAVGNLLGIVTESWPRDRIAAAFPGGMHDIPARPGHPDDDDLAQAIEVAEAAAAGDGLDVDGLARRFWDWGEANGLGMGGLTRDALTLYGGGRPRQLARRGAAGNVRPPRGLPPAEASRRAWEGCRAGNGALMRCAPIAIRWCGDPGRLVRESVLSAVPTHWDPRCGWSCAIAVLAAAAALRGGMPSPEALLRSAEDGMAAALPALGGYGHLSGMPPSVEEAVIRSGRAAGLDGMRLDGPDMGFTLLSLEVALASFRHAEDFASGLRPVIEAGGDTDTNGAIAGALLGARFGLAAIPARWRRRAAEIRRGRVSMEALADRLMAAADGRRHPPEGTTSLSGPAHIVTGGRHA